MYAVPVVFCCCCLSEYFSYQNFGYEFFVRFGLHLSGLRFRLPSGAESTAQPVNKKVDVMNLDNSL